MQNAILVLDHDPALAGLIARTLRNMQVYCVPVPFDITLAQAQALEARGLIVAAANGVELSLAGFDPALLNGTLPLLALGAMVPALCAHLGGAVLPREAESESVTLGLAEDPLFAGITGGERVLAALRDLTPPAGYACLATATERCVGFYSPQNRLFYCYGLPRRKTTVKTRAKPIQGGLSAPNPLFSAYFGPFPAYNNQKPANLNKGPHRTAHKLPKLRGPATIDALAQTTAHRTARRPVGPNVG